MSHRQRDTHTAVVTRATSDGTSDFMGAPNTPTDEDVATLDVRAASPVDAGNLGRDPTGEIVSVHKVLWTSDPAAGDVQPDDHVDLQTTRGADDGGVYLVERVRTHYGRTSRPDIWVLDCNEYAGT